MDKHIIPDDGFPHIESSSCNCLPSLCNSEGDIIYIHNNCHRVIDNVHYVLEDNKIHLN